MGGGQNVEAKKGDKQLPTKRAGTEDRAGMQKPRLSIRLVGLSTVRLSGRTRA